MTSTPTLVQSSDLSLLGEVIVDDLALVADRPLGWSLQRAAIIQFDRAIGAITDPDLTVAEGVHEARKAAKRIRAILRLVRDEIGSDIYRFENRSVRDAARLISPLRSSHVAVETLDGLRNRFGSRLSESAFDDTHGRLQDRKQTIETEALASGVLSDFVRAMRFGRARFASWSVSPDPQSPYGGHVRDDFHALSPGLARTYKRGRKELAMARENPTVTNLHEWRKRVKYLRHQTEVLAPIWPEVVGGLSVAVDHLGDLLGHDHDLAELVRLVTIRPELCPDALDRSLLSAIAQQERREVQGAAFVAGDRIYAESTGAFTKRLGSYWGSLVAARGPQ